MAFSCRDKAPGAACWIQIGSLLFIVSGCSGIQSALDPAGVEAERIATLFWVMTGGAVAIWLAVVTILLYALRRRRQIYSDKAASSLIFWAGAVFPTVTLLVLLGYALWLMPGLRPFAQAAKSTLMIEVTGKQFWWQVVYRPAGGPPVVSANEIRLPLSQRVELSLKSDDVIHSFWISLARRQNGHAAGQNQPAVAAGNESGHLSRPVRGILRHIACADGLFRHHHAHCGI